MAQDEQASGRQRRVEVRIKINLKVPDRDTFVERFSQNLSRTGIFIRASEPAPVGSRVHFEYRLADDTRVLRGIGIVRWARRAADAVEPDSPPGMGVEFIDLDPQTEELLTEIVGRFGEGRRAPKSPRRPRRAPTAAPVQKRDQAPQRLDQEEETALAALVGEATAPATIPRMPAAAALEVQEPTRESDPFAVALDSREEADEDAAQDVAAGLEEDAPDVAADLEDADQDVNAGLEEDAPTAAVDLGDDARELTAGLEEDAPTAAVDLGDDAQELTAGLENDAPDVAADLEDAAKDVNAGLEDDAPDVAADLEDAAQDVTAGLEDEPTPGTDATLANDVGKPVDVTDEAESCQDAPNELETEFEFEPEPEAGAVIEAVDSPVGAVELDVDEALIVGEADTLALEDRPADALDAEDETQLALVEAEEVLPPPQAAPAPAAPTTAPSPDARVVLDWCGSAMATTTAEGDRMSEPTFWVPRLAVTDGNITPADEGTYLPGLLGWYGRRWPSAYVLTAVRRLGVEIGPSTAGLVLRNGEQQALLADVITATIEPMLKPLGDRTVAEAQLLVPSNVTAAARRLLVDRLTVLGIERIEVIEDTFAVLRGAGVSVGDQLALHLDVSLCESRAALVRGATLVGTAAAPDLGLWDADQVVADWVLLDLMRRRGLDAEAEPSLFDGLLDQIADRRRDTPAGMPWNLDAAGVPLALEAETLEQRLAAISERVTLLAGALLEAAGDAPLGAMLLTTEEPAWPGLAGALEAAYGVRLIMPEPGPAARLRGAAMRR